MDKFEAKYDCLLFDMDDTLYPLSIGINLACRHNIQGKRQQFMVNQLKIEESEVPKMCLELYKEYGTTMAGLKVLGYKFENDEFHEFIHGRLPYHKLKPDPILRNLLLSIPLRKIIFTNADKAHTTKTLNKLDLEDCFEGIICFETLNPSSSSSSSSSISQILCKPDLNAFHAAIRIANLNPHKTMFFDDSPRNIVTAKSAGLKTVLIGVTPQIPDADYVLNTIHNIKEAIPEISQAQNSQSKPAVKPSSSTIAIAAVVQV